MLTTTHSTRRLKKATKLILVGELCWTHRKNKQRYPNSRSPTLARLCAVNTQVQGFFWAHTVNPSLLLHMTTWHQIDLLLFLWKGPHSKALSERECLQQTGQNSNKQFPERPPPLDGKLPRGSSVSVISKCIKWIWRSSDSSNSRSVVLPEGQ